MGLFSVLKAIGEKRGLLEKEQRADDNLPMSARIGAVVQMQAGDFLGATLNGSLLALPPERQIIRGISRVEGSFLGLNLYRYYFATGDNPNEDRRCLQVQVSESGEVIETIYWERVNRLYPSTQEEYDAYFKDAGYGLGDASFAFGRDDLIAMGYEKAVGDAPELSYTRSIGDLPDHISPVQLNEVRIDDDQGESGREVSARMMLYHRGLASLDEELLMILAETVQPDDADYVREAGDVYVDFLVGIKLSPMRIRVN